MLESERATASPSAPAPSALSRLPAEARVLHEQIEAAVPIPEPGADADRYRWYLKNLLGFSPARDGDGWVAHG